MQELGSSLGGGKFANGAVTGAYVMLFNFMQHPEGGPPLKSKTGTKKMEHDALPENPLLTVTWTTSEIVEGAATGLINVDHTETATHPFLSHKPDGAISSIEYQLNNTRGAGGISGGVSVFGAGGSNGSYTGGASFHFGPIQIGVSGTAAGWNSSVNVNVNIYRGNNRFVGGSFGVKPLGAATVAATYYAPYLIFAY